MLLVGGAGPSEAASGVDARWEVTWGSFRVATIGVRTGLSGNGYELSYTGGTAGILGLIAPLTADGRARGALAAGRPVPQAYEARTAWKDEERRTALGFDGAGKLTRLVLVGGGSDEHEPVPAALQTGPDPASLAIHAVLAARPQSRLAGTTFDGRRAMRFALACGSPGSGAPAGAVPAAGPLLPCELESELLAGGRRSARERKLRMEGPLRLWLGHVPAAGLQLPVRIEVATNYGTVEARLVAVTPVTPAGDEPPGRGALSMNAATGAALR